MIAVPIHPQPPPPPIKYPIEDLQVAPRVKGPTRPSLRYLTRETPMSWENPSGQSIAMESIGPLLETWDTLNVYCEVFKLDSFTFDDFVEAMMIHSEDIPCELFVEVHCAVLKQLVGSTAQGGEVLVRLPEMDEEEEEEELEEDEEPSQVTPEPEPKPAARATRSSFAKAEAEALRLEAREETPESLVKHRAAEMQADVDWIESLQKRDFADGGWEMIMVGLLHQLSKNPRLERVCEEVLSHIAPLDMEATKETARVQYARLAIDLRAEALQTICMLCAETKAIRNFMEECSDIMTTYRKEKIDWQRQRKQL